MNDDELLARLRAADPALTSSAPLPDVHRLVEATLSTDTAPGSAHRTAGMTVHPTRASEGRGRRRVLGLAAVAGLLLLAGAVTGGVMLHGHNGHTPAAGPLTLVAASGSAEAKCAEPVPDDLRRFPTLFVGTATSVKGPSVAFRVDQWLKGGDVDTVVLDSAPDRPEAMTFTKGGKYIVAADKDGVVPLCGANMVPEETVSEFRRAFGK
ncbi:MAG: hypothetical protein ACJ736_37900 [Streptomyces sp.]